jgi:predicted secreted protein
MTAKLYQKSVEWIARNDEPTIMDERDVSKMISVVLVADIHGKDPREVAKDIVGIRREDQRIDSFWASVRDHFGDFDHEVKTDYSGRGMFGKVSPAAIVVESRDRDFEEKTGCSVDSMGMDVVYYLR